VASFNMAAANEAAVKRVHYISEMSQDCEYFNCRGEGVWMASWAEFGIVLDIPTHLIIIFF
jgi:hypothetical protein